MFGGLKYKILHTLHKTTEQKLKKLEDEKEKFSNKPVRIEIDKHGFVTINSKPMRGNAVYWGKERDEDGKRQDLYTYLYGQPLRIKENNRPCYICIEGMPIALNPHSLILLGAKGPIAVDWPTFSRQVNTLLEEKSQGNMVKARIEALGAKELKKKELPEWLGFAVFLGVLAVIFIIAFLKPDLVLGFFGKGASQAAGQAAQALTPK